MITNSSSKVSDEKTFIIADLSVALQFRLARYLQIIIEMYKYVQMNRSFINRL